MKETSDFKSRRGRRCPSRHADGETVDRLWSDSSDSHATLNGNRNMRTGWRVQPVMGPTEANGSRQRNAHWSENLVVAALNRLPVPPSDNSPTHTDDPASPSALPRRRIVQCDAGFIAHGFTFAS